MRKYRVLNDCYGFKGCYWEKGQIAELGDHEAPPKEHFEALSPAAVDAKKPVKANGENEKAKAQAPASDGEKAPEVPAEPAASEEAKSEEPQAEAPAEEAPAAPPAKPAPAGKRGSGKRGQAKAEA